MAHRITIRIDDMEIEITDSTVYTNAEDGVHLNRSILSDEALKVLDSIHPRALALVREVDEMLTC